MCRFAVYCGPKIPVSHLLLTPEHSLLRQSYSCRERSDPFNQDGYGIGWYNEQRIPHWILGDSPADKDPAFEPAARAIRSHCFFGHVRAATKTMRVSIENCHPFAAGKLLWMHNGLIAGLERIEPLLRKAVEPGPYRLRGDTDSEYSFALFLQKLRGRNPDQPEDLLSAMTETVQQLEQWRRDLKIEETHYLNLAVTNGSHSVVTRYYHFQDRHLTLYVWRGSTAKIAAWSQSQDYEPGKGIIVASEPLVQGDQGWEPLPVNHLVMFGSGLYRVAPIDPPA